MCADEVKWDGDEIGWGGTEPGGLKQRDSIYYSDQDQEAGTFIIHYPFSSESCFSEGGMQEW